MSVARPNGAGRPLAAGRPERRADESAGAMFMMAFSSARCSSRPCDAHPAVNAFTVIFSMASMPSMVSKVVRAAG